MSAIASAPAQVNVRMDRELKERGDATLRLAGSSPARVVRQLWERLAEGGGSYEQVMAVLSPRRTARAVDEADQLVRHSAQLFKELGAHLGMDLETFVPDPRDEHEILEEIEWTSLVEKGLA